ncbi:hypothetical protein [Bizionia arctica]|uniref:Uncharacterized protein n=1 Tax=Bizionia arctica TaxID=1495645 RepID=A0A917LKF3_9FLAO|nr:hypothetical protein [Bizionia arctica]GGG35696.1 hypothetical protein GCM10010976_04260 [Bizionia arctica]
MRAVFIICLFSSFFIHAQDSVKIKVEAPKIVTKLHLGKTYHVDAISIKFVDVLTDSRCPEDVTCIWAGQVVALIEIYENDTLLEQKEMVFEPGKTKAKELRSLYSNEDKTILANSVLPYPKKSREKIKKEDYYLQLEMSN